MAETTFDTIDTNAKQPPKMLFIPEVFYGVIVIL